MVLLRRLRQCGSQIAVSLLLLCTASSGVAQPTLNACPDGQTLSLLKQARWDEARQHLEQLLAEARARVIPAAPPTLTVCLQTSLAAVLGRVERFAEAVDLLDKTIALSTAQLGADHRATLNARFMQAGVYSAKGQYDVALPVYRALLPVYEKRFGVNDLEVATLLRNTSISLHWLGNYADALPIDQRVLQISATLRPGPGSCDTADTCISIAGRAHQNLADTLRRLMRAPEALPHAEQGLRMQRQALGAEHPNTLDAQLALASVLIGLNRIDEARLLQRQTMDVATQRHGSGHPITRKAAGDFAASSRAGDERQEALRIDEGRLAQLKQQLGAQHPDVLLTSSNLVGRYLLEGRHAEALVLAEAAVTDMVARSDTLMFDDRSQEAWARAQSRLTNAYIFLLARGPRKADAFLVSEFLKHRKLALAIDGLSAGASDPAGRQDIKASSRRLGLLDQQIAIRRSLGQDTRQLDSTRAQEFLTWRRLADRPATELPSTRSLPKWGRQLLAKGETVISYRFLDRFLYAFVVTPQTATVLVLDDQDRVRPTIEAYRLAMRQRALHPRAAGTDPKVWQLAGGAFKYSDQKPAADARPVTDLNELLRFLSATLVGKVLPPEGSQKRLLISVDQNLGHVPFDALPLDAGLLGDRFHIAVLPSFALFDTLTDRQAAYAQLARLPLLAVGGAQYARFERVSPFITIQRERQTTITPMDAKILWQAVQRDRSKLPLVMAQLGMGPSDLPGSKVEVEAIGRMFDATGGEKALVLTGAHASEERLNTLADTGQLERFRILHFSTHGYLSDDEPGLSAIVLSQVNRAPGTDGYLTSAEISLLKLHSDLVVVSACDSGASETAAGEGAPGLSFALFQAGTVSSLLTLWPIEDDDSRRFMEQFYAELQSAGSTSLALQRTKTWARRQRISDHVIQGFVMWGI